ncbi:sodium:calcium antiporter [Chloroflexota bacterium]
MVWIKFILCVLIIFFSGKKVAKYGDIIAEKTGLGGLWIGLVIIAMVTSLPELFNGVSAVVLVGEPDLTIGDLLGANMFNMLNLALLDLIHRNGSLLTVVSQTHRLTGVFSLLLVLSVVIFIFLSSRFHPMSIGWIGWYTPFIILLYLVFIRILFLYEKHRPSHEEATLAYGRESTEKAYFYFTISAAFIIGAGIWLAFIGNEIAQVYGWGKSFVGSLFLAFATTLPEITVSFAAMRIGADDLAVANLIGSNLFNMTIISIDDLLYLKGPVLAAVSENHLVIALVVMLMSIVFCVVLGSKPRRFFRLSWWNLVMIFLFFLGAYSSFTLV